MITDFGFGFTEGALKPKDDLIQIGDMAARMLQSVEWEKLGPIDRRIYHGFCHGAALKRLREVSRIERGDDEGALVEDVLAEIRDTTNRGKSIRGAIIPRLYLRRLLVPFFTLTFSKADNIAMDSSYFTTLLLYPEQLPALWRKKRPQALTRQGEFDW